MPWQINVNRFTSLNNTDRMALIAELALLRAELDDIRAKYSVLQGALNAGLVVGAANYPNATMQLAAARFNAVT